MISFLTYIVETSISVSVFYIFYELFLKRDTWFRFNRYYLLFGIIFSFILPLLDFSASSVLVNSQNQFEFNEYIQISSSINSFKEQTVETNSYSNYIMLFYLTIGCLFFVRIIYQLIKIFKTINANEIIKYRNKNLVLMNNTGSPFSFYNYIFISKEDYGPDSYRDGSNELLLHEFTHAKQMHSIDVILLELILVLQWFNPFIYRYRLAFKEVHEYLADRGVLKANKDKIAYQKLILDQIEKSFNVNLASQFNYSLTKNRIKMMTRIKSGKLSKFKILLVLPLIAILLMAFTIDTSKENSIIAKETYLQIQSNSVPSIFPVKKVEGVKISSVFGMRIHPISKKKMMHSAVDIKAPDGTPVYATADGLVRKVKLNHTEGKGYGRYIIIDHENGYSTLYSQLSKYNVKEGNEVKQGDIIGYVGSSGISTGPHLHYEVMKDGENVDPEKYF
jgi:murein DD-endopeptidase MepM/ murein hydrolase activator NlpD